MVATYAFNAEGAVLESQVAGPGASSCATQVEIPAGQVELPTNIAFEGTPIVSNSQLVPVPHAGRIAVTWDASSDGHADFYYVQIQRLLDASHVVPVEQVVTFDHKVTFPAQDFVAADTYQILVVSTLGYPNAAAGDFRSIGTTMGVATYTTPSFRVTSP